MKFYTTKDLSNTMLLHPRTVKRWWKRLGVPPKIGGRGLHRWTPRQVRLLVKRWQAYWAKRGLNAERASDKFGGVDKFMADQKQLKFKFGFTGGQRASTRTNPVNEAAFKQCQRPG